MQKLLGKFIGSLVFAECRGCISSEIAILHLAKCPIEIIIAQTITAHFALFWVLSQIGRLHSIQIYQERNIIVDFILYVFHDNYQKSTNWSFFMRCCSEIEQNESHRYCNELAIVRCSHFFFIWNSCTQVMSNSFGSGFIFISPLCETVLGLSIQRTKKKQTETKETVPTTIFLCKRNKFEDKCSCFCSISRIKLALTRHISFAHLPQHNIKWCIFRMQ